MQLDLIIYCSSLVLSLLNSLKQKKKKPPTPENIRDSDY